MHSFRGLVAMNENTLLENMALALDLCAKFGQIIQDEAGSWVMSP